MSMANGEMKTAVKGRGIKEQDREIWIAENRLHLGKDDILRVTVVGTIDEKIAQGFREFGIQLSNLVEGKVNVLIDLNKAGKRSPEARKIVRELSSHEKTRKIAAFGSHPVARIIAAFGVGPNLEKKYFRFCKTKEDALEWLKR